MLIISIVKSSLALSLGLVGALSIVRFRAAIKEPEELTYLFFAIALGLGLGANQQLIVVVAFVIMSIIIWTRYFLKPGKRAQNLLLSVSSTNKEGLGINEISDVISRHFKKYELKRFDENADVIEASFLLNINDTRALEACKQDLQKANKSLSITFIDNNSY